MQTLSVEWVVHILSDTKHWEWVMSGKIVIGSVKPRTHFRCRDISHDWLIKRYTESLIGRGMLKKTNVHVALSNTISAVRSWDICNGLWNGFVSNRCYITLTNVDKVPRCHVVWRQWVYYKCIFSFILITVNNRVFPFFCGVHVNCLL